MKIGKIVNEQGYIIETVAYYEETKEIYMYELKENERFIENYDREEFLKPRWNGQSWEEGASQEELEEERKRIEEANKEVNPSPDELPVTKAEFDKLVAENKDLLETQDAIMLAQTEMYEDSEKRADEIMMAMTEIYEMQAGGN